MKFLLTLLLCYTTAFGQMNGIRVTDTGRLRGPTISDEISKLVCSDELVLSMQKLLWPDATDELKDGPVDSGYYALTQAQIDDLFSFVKARHELTPYISEAWDCDDFALEFHYLARVWSVRQMQGEPVSPTVGIAYVALNGPYPMIRGERFVQGYHAINVILRDDGQWFFVEPQNGNIVPIEGSIYEGAIEVIKILI